MSQAGVVDVVASNPDIPTLFQTPSGSAVPLFNVINFTGTNGITVSAAGNTVTISSNGSGDVVGPASAVDNDIVIFNGVTGKIIKDTGISSLAPTFVGDVTSLTRMIVPYDTGAGEGMYFSDGSNAFRQIGSAGANYFFGNSGNSSLVGIANTGAGQATLLSLVGGSQNTAMGNGALLATSNGSSNCGFGYLTGQGIANAQHCNAFGVGALSGTCGDSNNAFGTITLQNCTGVLNAAFGEASLQNLNAGNFNTAFGNFCASGLLTGSNNVFLGYNSGSTYNAAESGNVLIDSLGVNGESNVTRIGTNQTDCYVAGINGVTVTGTAVLCAADGQLGTVVSSARYKENILDIPEDISVLSLRPVEFNYKGFTKISYGLIAEEVDRDFPYLCFYKEGKPESVKYQELCVFLLAEVQRLDARLRDLEQIGA